MQKTEPQEVEVAQINERPLPYLLLSISAILIAWPITLMIQTAEGRSHPATVLLYQLIFFAVMVLSIIATRANRPVNRWLTLLTVVWLILTGFVFIDPSNSWPLLSGYFIIAIFQFSLVGVLLIYIFQAKYVTQGVLIAASTIYLLIASVFVPIYDLIETTTFMQTNGQHAFSDGVTLVGEALPWQTLIYYSVAVVTTLGFGDVLPIVPWARAASMLESLLGVLYLTFVVARLVSLFSESPSD